MLIQKEHTKEDKSKGEELKTRTHATHPEYPWSHFTLLLLLLFFTLFTLFTLFYVFKTHGAKAQVMKYN